MMLALAIVVVVLLCILSMHFSQHYQIHSQKCKETASSNHSNTASNIQQTQMSLLRTTNYAPHCCFALSSIDDEEFDFFPASFLFYLAFMASICILMIVTQSIRYNAHSNHESLSGLIWKPSFESNHNHSVFNFHAIHAQSIIDYILIYAVMILAVWVSLFSFYRYYTTLISTKTLQTPSTKILFQKFAVYAFIFCVLFMLQIHVYYYLYPVVIALFCSFNFFCCYKFAAMLVKHYKVFLDINEMRMDIQDILQCVLFTKHTSLFCSLLQSINLSVFLITYNVKILYYLPILWSLSSFVLSLNFVRNYKFLQKHLFVVKQCCYCICYRKNVQTNTNPSANTLKSRQKPTPTEEVYKRDALEVIIDDDDKYHDFDDLMQAKMDALPPINALGLETKNSKSLDIYPANDAIDDKPPLLLRAKTDPLASVHNTGALLMDVDAIRVLETPQFSMESESVTLPGFSRMKPPKALALLGITAPNTPSKSLQPKLKYSDIVMKPLPLSKLRRFSGLPKLSLSKHYDDDKENDGDTPTSPLALHLNVTPLVDAWDHIKNIDFDAAPIEKIEEQRTAEENVTAGCHADDFGEELDEKEDELPELEGVFSGNREVPRLVNHVQTHSAPPLKLDEMILSLNILAKYGFCSRESINSVKQLNDYKNKQSSHLHKSAFF